MVVALTIRTDRFRAALTSVSGKGRLIGEGDFSKAVGRLAKFMFVASTEELVLVQGQDALGGHLKVNIGEVRQFLGGLSKMERGGGVG